MEAKESRERKISECEWEIFFEEIPNFRLYRTKIQQFLQFYPK